MVVAPVRVRRPAPQVRKPPVRFSDHQIPRWWVADNPVLTHAANAMNLVFPLGERFFVRSVAAYRDQIDDPELLEHMRAFFGQETQHGRAHEAAFALLDEQGLEYESFLAWYEGLAFGVLERVAPAKLRLSTTVALEHLTATLAAEVLLTHHLDDLHPAMAELMGWHAVEEIEHRSVAFDVLAEVDDSELLRLAGLAVGVSTFLWFWTAGIRHLVRQEGLDRETLRQARKQARELGRGRAFIRRAIGSYLRRGFHPDDEPLDALAAGWLASRQLEPTVA